jgi:hypothetical protein
VPTPHREFYLAVGELAPTFNGLQMTASWLTIENVPDFETSGLQGQRECL